MNLTAELAVEAATNVNNVRYASNLRDALTSGSQNKLVLSHLLNKPTITQLEAWELYRVHRLASRINDLKNLGVKIGVNRKMDLTGRPYVEYSLIQNG